MPAQFTPTSLPEVLLIQPQIFGDSRGHFFECFKRSEFLARGLVSDFVQENHSSSQNDVLRGLHYQKPPAAQTKLVRVVQGTIWDVAVDIRPDSPRFGQWHAELLSAESHKQLYIPAGFGHGFKVVSSSATVLYKTDTEYAPELEGGFSWNDPDVGIPWEIETPILSARDQQFPSLHAVREAGELDGFTKAAGFPFAYQGEASSS